MEGIHIKAAIHKVQVDAEGEGTITFKVPKSHIKETLSMAILTEEVLDLTITKEEKGKTF